MKYTVAPDGSGDFTSLQEAVDRAAEQEDAAEIRILAGEYHEKVIVHKSHLRIIGEGPEKTVLTWNGCAKDLYPDGTEKGTFMSSTLMVTGHDVAVENDTRSRQRR